MTAVAPPPAASNPTVRVAAAHAERLPNTGTHAANLVYLAGWLVIVGLVALRFARKVGRR